MLIGALWAVLRPNWDYYRQPYCNLRLDNELHEARLLFWQVAQLRLTGFLYWDLNYWGQVHAPPGGVMPSYAPIDGAALTSPFIDPAEWSPWQTGPHDVGDGKLTYGGTDGPLGSIRLHGIRDGIGYFSLLKAKKGDAAVQAVLAQISHPDDLTQHATGSGADLKRMMALREAVARELEGTAAAADPRAKWL